MSDVDSDVPDTGAAFTFGKSRFSNDEPGKFWIRNDPILQVACGDEHTALLTASGRIFTFGSNEWGQLGHGHTNSLTRPSCVKCLKHERATLIACGRSHTLVATDTGHVYGFGTNSEGQLGSPNEYTIHTSPVRVQGLEDVAIKMLAAGADHSVALTDKGVVYIWGGGSEGQLGLEKQQCLVPTEVKFEYDVMCISAGYYHSAFVTVDGKLYTCGENECGKLGVSDKNMKKSPVPRHVSGIPGRVVYASCGGNHTIALTADGKTYSFGNGFSGQLGLGDRIVEAYKPNLVTFFSSEKIARVSCGESHTGFLSDTGHLYTCGDRRHGKLGLIDDQNITHSSQFLPTPVTRFQHFQVQQVACGGCHMLVLATKKKVISSSPDVCPNRRNRSHVVKCSKMPEKLHGDTDSLQSFQTKLPPIFSSQTSSSIQTKKNTGSVTSLKHSHRPRLPSITKSPVWYVPLEKVDVGTGDANSDEDEVLSKLEQRCSLLQELETDESIRHVDSDVESDTPETFDLNKTHTLISIDNTIAIIRPVIPSDNELSTPNEKDASLASIPTQLDLQHNNNVKTEEDETTISKVNNQSTLEAHNFPRNSKKNSKDNTVSENKDGNRSRFYDDEEKNVSSEKSSSSTLSKSSKACTVL